MVIGEEREPRPFLVDQMAFASPLPARGGSLKLAGITLVTSLFIYTLCLPTSVPGDAAGELVTAAAMPGVAHPPGYPLWTILGYLFVKLIPFSTPVWRVAFLSALCEPMLSMLQPQIGLKSCSR